jgi:Tol biopolymer transport system component/DNA-binding winged helix-turn-helix (wHTH) protein
MFRPDNHLYEFGPFVLDARSRILLREGATVRLTPKAFETLLVLVRHGVEVVDKEQLLKEVWPDTFVEEGSLSRNIHELRKALGDVTSEPSYIETIPKRGYRFVAPVKISAPDTVQTAPAVAGGETTIIEKHTFARVLSEEFEAPASESLPSETTLTLPGDTVVRTRKTLFVACGIAVLLLAGFVGTFLYLKLRGKSSAPETHAKTTLVRLTSNSAFDGGSAWSPDGSRIAFWSNRDGKAEIYVMNTDGSNVKRLTNNLSDDVGPKWSPDGNKILFDSERDGNKEVYVMDADGGNQTRLTRNNATDSATSWSPDGSQIAFASNRDHVSPFDFDIYLMSADGSNVRKIVEDREYDAEPKWSPDGKKILFISGRNGNFDLYVTNIDGTEQRNLTADYDKNDIAPAWSPDGNNIAFVRTVQGKEQIFVMNADGSNPKRVTNNSSNNAQPAWSPDGSKLVFQTDRDGNFEITVMSVDGELVQLTDDPGEDLDPDWSPDGSKLAFSSNRAGMHHIYVVNADGSSVTQITNAKADDTEPAWSRDGKRLAFVRAIEGNSEVYVVNADSSNETRLTFNNVTDISPDWSPDGRIFFTSNRDGRKEIYAMNADGGSVSRLTTTGATGVVVSPDGSKIAYISPSPELIATYHPLQVFVADPDGSNVRMVTKDLQSIFGPCWYADAASIVFAIDNLGVASNIFQIDLDGNHHKRLTAGPKIDTQPAVSPDGSRLAFQSNRDGNYEIYVMNLRKSKSESSP